jgi:hypothetical protein
VAKEEPNAEVEGRTYDPNLTTLWPTFPRGTRLPVHEIALWKDILGLIFMLILMTGVGLLIWWLVETVHRR